MEQGNKIEEVLSSFSGTEKWYKHLSGNLYTDGIKYLADAAECYWLIDEILFWEGDEKDVFHIWELKVDLDNHEGILTCQEDIDRPFLVNKKIEYTDFPLKKIKLYYSDGVLLLPSEW